MTITTTITTISTTPVTTPATTPGSAPRRRAGRTLTAILGSGSLLFAVGCGADPEDAPAAVAEEVTGSAADVERPVTDEHTRHSRIENARGSDRHLERSAAAIAEYSRQWRAANARGNDRHLEMLAAGHAGTSDRQ